MRYLILTFLILSCSRHDDGGTSLDIHKYQVERDTLCANYNPALLTKCDRSTFHLAMSAMCPSMALPTIYEYPSGKWNRAETECYPAESRSETSQDAYLSLVLTQNKPAIARAYEYAASVNWETGEPAGSSGYITTPVRQVMHDAISLTSDTVTSVQDMIDIAKKSISGFRGHLIANYLWARARQMDGLLAPAVAYLKLMHDETPKSPYLSCLYHRFSDGEQKDTLILLDNMGTQSYGWGSDSNSWQLEYALTVSCLEGK